MRINLRYGVAAGMAAAAFTTLGSATAQASGTPGTVMSAAASRYPGHGLGQGKLGLPAHQGTALRSNHRCDWDDRWCRDHDDYGHFHHGDYGDFHHFRHFRHRDYDDFR